MPITKSAIKAARQNIARRTRRQPFKTQMKTMIRTFTDLVTAKKLDEATALLPKVHKAVDMAAKKDIIHRNNAARKKAMFARMLKVK
ncbi:30S ribosomal protein S20 [Candidatus Peribacteria bacterium]|nr:30S ribosomal protein S20 [Candidatus Peribacteria bacterium]